MSVNIKRFIHGKNQSTVIAEGRRRRETAPSFVRFKSAVSKRNEAEIFAPRPDAAFRRSFFNHQLWRWWAVSIRDGIIGNGENIKRREGRRIAHGRNMAGGEHAMRGGGGIFLA